MMEACMEISNISKTKKKKKKTSRVKVYLGHMTLPTWN